MAMKKVRSLYLIRVIALADNGLVKSKTTTLEVWGVDAQEALNVVAIQSDKNDRIEVYLSYKNGTFHYTPTAIAISDSGIGLLSYRLVPITPTRRRVHNPPPKLVSQ